LSPCKDEGPYAAVGTTGKWSRRCLPAGQHSSRTPDPIRIYTFPFFYTAKELQDHKCINGNNIIQRW